MVSLGRLDEYLIARKKNRRNARIHASPVLFSSQNAGRKFSTKRLAVKHRHIAAFLVADDDLIAAAPGVDRPTGAEQGSLEARGGDTNAIAGYANRNLDLAARAGMANIQHHGDKLSSAAGPRLIAVANLRSTARKRAANAMLAFHTAQFGLSIGRGRPQRCKSRRCDEDRRQTTNGFHDWCLSKLVSEQWHKPRRVYQLGKL